MTRVKSYPSEFKDKLCMEVNAYQSEHKCTLLKALLEVSNNNNVSRYTLKQWYYDHGAKSVNKERKLKVAAMSVSSSRSFDLNSFIKNLNPFKRFLACIIGLDKYSSKPSFKYISFIPVIAFAVNAIRGGIL